MNDANLLQWESGSRTDVGTVRKLNEDAVLDRPERGIWAVADGMGGHAAGDFASSAVTDALAAIGPAASLGAIVGEVRSRLQEVNRSLSTEARQRGQEMIGTTVVVLMLYGRHGVTLWAGDSRLYRRRAGELSQLSRDHSQVEEFISQGLLTRGQAEHHPASNIITRAIGVSGQLELEAQMFEIAPGDTFLLCSDGLYRELAASEISACLAMDDPQQACDALVERALVGGARDNVSVVVVRVVDEDRVTRTSYNPSVPPPPAGGQSDDPTLC